MNGSTLPPNPFHLAGKAAFVTGASKGIGLAIAEGMGRLGARVMISSRDASACKKVAASLRDEGLEIWGTGCHTGEVDAIQSALAETMERFGRLDILINNAATNPYFGPIQNAEGDVFDKILEVNLKGPFLLCKHAYPFLKNSGRASVINISSVEAIRPDTGLGLYSVSKAALNSLTQVLAKEWGPDGIRVNALCPGIVKTKFSTALWQNADFLKHIEHNLPLGRIAMPEEMVGFAIFLASDASSYCTGGIYLADGGYTT